MRAGRAQFIWVAASLGARLAVFLGAAPQPTSLNHLGLERWPPHPEGFVSEDSLSEASTAHPGLPRCWHSTVLASKSPGTRSRRLVMACHCVTLEVRRRALQVRRPSSIAQRPERGWPESEWPGGEWPENECPTAVLEQPVLADVAAHREQAWAVRSCFAPSPAWGEVFMAESAWGHRHGSMA